MGISTHRPICIPDMIIRWCLFHKHRIPRVKMGPFKNALPWNSIFLIVVYINQHPVCLHPAPTSPLWLSWKIKINVETKQRRGWVIKKTDICDSFKVRTHKKSLGKRCIHELLQKERRKKYTHNRKEWITKTKRGRKRWRNGKVKTKTKNKRKWNGCSDDLIPVHGSPWKLVAIRHSNMRLRSIVRLGPHKHGLLVVRWTTDSDTGLVLLEKGVAGNLGISSNMGAVTKSANRVGSILGVQVVTARDGILSRVREGLAVAARKRILLEVVVAHHSLHSVERCDGTLVTTEDLGARCKIIVEPGSILGLEFGHTRDLADKLVQREVVTGKVPELVDRLGDIGDLDVSRDLVKDHHSTRSEGAAGVKQVVVNDHPLVVVGAGVGEGEEVHPRGSSRGKAVSDHVALPLQNGIGSEILLEESSIAVTDRGLHGDETGTHSVKVITGIEVTRVRTERDGDSRDARRSTRVELKVKVVALVHTKHGLKIRPGHVGNKQLVVGSLDKSTAVAGVPVPVGVRVTHFRPFFLGALDGSDESLKVTTKREARYSILIEALRHIHLVAGSLVPGKQSTLLVVKKPNVVPVRVVGSRFDHVRSENTVLIQELLNISRKRILSSRVDSHLIHTLLSKLGLEITGGPRLHGVVA